MGKTITLKIPALKNYWKILTFIFAILFVLSYFNLLNFSGKFYSISSIPKDEIGQKAIDYINSNLVRPGTSASLVKVEDLGSVYRVMTRYQGRDIPVYVSKDGNYLFLGAFNLNQATSSNQPKASTPEIPKREKPDVKLFVMSYCPFGLQAEKAMLPVMKLLDGKASITIHFVDYCMHGTKEVYENLRQYCIQKEQKDKYYDYLLCFVQSGNYSKCLKEANVDENKLNDCMQRIDKEYGITEALNDQSKWMGRFPPFNVEKDLNDKYGVRGSPTLVINDKVVSIARSPESYKEAICSAFVNPPEECNQKLSTQTASPGFGPLTETSSSSSNAQCS